MSESVKLSDEVKKELELLGEKVDFPYKELEERLIRLMSQNWDEKTALTVLKNQNDIIYRNYQRGPVVDVTMRVIGLSGPYPAKRRDGEPYTRADVFGMAKIKNADTSVTFSVDGDALKMVDGWLLGESYNFKASLPKTATTQPIQLNLLRRELKFTRTEADDIPALGAVMAEIVKSGKVLHVREAQNHIYIKEAKNFEKNYYAGTIAAHIVSDKFGYRGFRLASKDSDISLMVRVGGLLSKSVMGAVLGAEAIVHGYVKEVQDYKTSENVLEINADGVFSIDAIKKFMGGDKVFE